MAEGKEMTNLKHYGIIKTKYIRCPKCRKKDFIYAGKKWKGLFGIGKKYEAFYECRKCGFYFSFDHRRLRKAVRCLITVLMKVELGYEPYEPIYKGKKEVGS